MTKLIFLLLWLQFSMTTTEEHLEMFTDSQMAAMCGLDEDEFEYFAQVVEAESDGRTEYHEGKLYVAACIWDRINGPYFPNTVRGVLDQSGQFTTTYRGSCSKRATPASRLAVLEAYYLLQNGDIETNILYFNCIGYSYGSAYGKIGDNYFTTYGEQVDFTWNDEWFEYSPCGDELLLYFKEENFDG